jgi:hypothetical protein
MGEMLGIIICKERYERWWLGKYCCPANQRKPHKKVTAIEMVGPPSFVYGSIILHYEDDTDDIVGGGFIEGCYRREAFKPRKCDVNVLDQSRK